MMGHLVGNVGKVLVVLYSNGQAMEHKLTLYKFPEWLSNSGPNQLLQRLNKPGHLFVAILAPSVAL